MAVELHIDVETFSSVDITNCGSYKYFESPDFEILILCYSLKDEDGKVWPVHTVDLAQGDKVPDMFWHSLAKFKNLNRRPAFVL